MAPELVSSSNSRMSPSTTSLRQFTLLMRYPINSLDGSLMFARSLPLSTRAIYFLLLHFQRVAAFLPQLLNKFTCILCLPLNQSL